MIRLATERDAEAIAYVLLAAFSEFEHLYTPEGFRATTPERDAVLARMREGPIWVAVDGKDVIGTVSAICRHGECYIRGMGVLPSSRVRGVGSRLLETVETHARRHGARRTYLSTTPFLERAIHLYERYGFRLSDEGPQDLFGTPLFTMSKPL